MRGRVQNGLATLAVVSAVDGAASVAIVSRRVPRGSRVDRANQVHLVPAGPLLPSEPALLSPMETVPWSSWLARPGHGDARARVRPGTDPGHLRMWRRHSRSCRAPPRDAHLAAGGAARCAPGQSTAAAVVVRWSIVWNRGVVRRSPARSAACPRPSTIRRGASAAGVCADQEMQVSRARAETGGLAAGVAGDREVAPR